ncbi:hypothetical protein Trydic_g6858 [Trypoxylus dichotomus]
MRYWADINFRQLHQRLLHSAKVTVWRAIFSAGIADPLYFEESEVTVTVTLNRYVEILEEFFSPRVEKLDLVDIWFQQDGTTAHTSRMSMALLRERFQEHLVSIWGDLEWPAGFPDLAHCDFFVAFFEIPCLRQPPKDPSRRDSQHPGNNCRYTHWCAGKSDERRQKSIDCVYKQLGCHLPDTIKTN